jgi:hypothetical protein
VVAREMHCTNTCDVFLSFFLPFFPFFLSFRVKISDFSSDAT